jgi:N-acetylmuramoyl-L-alanine amidase
MALLSRPLNTLLTTAAVVLAGLAAPPIARAQQFDQQPIDPNLAVAIATPVRDGALHNLMILTQVPNRRQCWQEQPQANGTVTVDPLLLNFDFAGACDRKTDSNGYSVRINGQDLGVHYRLEISTRQNDLVLFARPSRDRSAPPIEIGRTNGRTNGLLRIQLNPGWQMAYRVFNGQRLGHIYLTHDAPLDVRLATGLPSLGQAGSTPLPVRPAAPPSATASLPQPPSGTLSPLPPPPGSGPVASGNHFRVVVPITGPNTLQQVRNVEPEAFRTTAEGQAVVQVGLFRDRQRADEVYAALVTANLPAKILSASAPTVASNPVIPPIPQGAIVVVIDPGHGGRDPGAIGIGGIQEKQINTTISNRVRQQLQAAGITVLMTRDSDVFVELETRAQMANRAGANLFVSIHANAISMSRPDVNGLETYYFSSGERLARSIHSAVLRNVNMRDRGVRQARFYVLRHTSMPSVLVETGFVTGAEDAARFRDPAAVNRIADGIARGILDYLGR